MGNRRWSRLLLVAAAWGALASWARAQEPAPPSGAEAIIAGLHADGVETRRAAASALRSAASDVQRQALPAMIERLLKEKDGQVRLGVLDAVTSLGSEAAPAIPALLETLRTDAGGSRQEESHQDYRSALALAAVGKPAVGGLRGLLRERGRKENVRAEVVMALGRIGPDAAPAVPELVPLLGDPSERIRREASQALGRIGSSAVEPLIAAAEDRATEQRARAVEALGQLARGDERAGVAVLARVDDQAPEVRAAAVQALARFEVPEDRLRPILAASLRHADGRVRLAVVNVLAARRSMLAALAPGLESLAGSSDPGTARHAAYLLGLMGPDVMPRLIAALRRPESRIDVIAEAMSHIGRSAGGEIGRALRDPDPRVRRGAALAMGQIRPPVPGTAASLTAGLGDADREVRAAFLTAVGQLGPRAAGSAPAVRGLLADPSPEIRALAIEVLWHCAARDRRLLADLTPRLDDDDPAVQRRAIDTIRAMGPPGQAVLPQVIARLKSSDTNVRVAAAEFIASHGQAPAGAVPALVPLLGDATPRVRIVVAETLGILGKPAQPALASLARLLDDREAEVRKSAVAAIASLELDATVVRPHFARALRDDNSDVRRAGMRGIQRLGPDGALLIPDIIRMAERRENVRSVERVLRRFERKVPDPRSTPDLVKLLDHREPRVRLLAIRFLALAGREAREAIPVLERMRDDNDAEVRRQAEAACKRIREETAGHRT